MLDNRAALVAGALSSDPRKAKASAPDYDIPADRAYGSYHELIDSELKLPADERIDFVTVATPNHTHFEIAKAAVEAGFNVICDKPMTFDLDAGRGTGRRRRQVGRGVRRLAQLHRLSAGAAGAARWSSPANWARSTPCASYYIQGWLRTRLENETQKQAAWRTDPAKSGAAGCFGDIGTHAYNLARYMTGLLPESISCHLKIFETGRKLDDYGHAVIRFENGALGTRHGLADQPRPRERSVHRDRRHQGLARMAPGRAEQDARPPQRPAAHDLHAQSQRRRT